MSTRKHAHNAAMAAAGAVQATAGTSALRSAANNAFAKAGEAANTSASASAKISIASTTGTAASASTARNAAVNPSVTVSANGGQSASTANWWSLLVSDVHCVLQRDPAARNLLEAWTIYPGVHAIAHHRIAHALWTRGWRYLPRWISFVSRCVTQVDIHPGARIGARFFIDHGNGVVIGETAEVGEDVTLYHGVTLGGTAWHAGKRHPTVGNGVVVGAGAKILGPIRVGDRARIAANSVVIEAVPAGATVVGIPGRVVAPQRHTTHGFDLDHHLIPDPVGKAIACLLDRVALLERTHLAAGDTNCATCDDACIEPIFARTLHQPAHQNVHLE